jgi:hypothetical protein
MKGNTMQTQLLGSSGAPWFDIFGPLLQFSVTPADASEAFALIPLRSHADPEVLFVLAGELQFLQDDGSSSRWQTAKPREGICIRSDVKHALRNSSQAPATVPLTTTPNMYRFFRELGKPFCSGQPAVLPTPEDIQRFKPSPPDTVTGWLLPEENAGIGLGGFSVLRKDQLTISAPGAWRDA